MPTVRSTADTPKPWPCWTCAYRGGPDTSETFYCTRPMPLGQHPFWLLRHLQQLEPSHHRYVGTEKQLRGESPNEVPDCPAYERG